MNRNCGQSAMKAAVPGDRVVLGAIELHNNLPLVHAGGKQLFGVSGSFRCDAKARSREALRR